MCQSGWGSSGVCAGSGGVARRYTDYESSFVRLGGRDARSEHDDRWKGRDATERSRDLKTQTTRVLKLRRIDEDAILLFARVKQRQVWQSLMVVGERGRKRRNLLWPGSGGCYIG